LDLSASGWHNKNMGGLQIRRGLVGTVLLLLICALWMTGFAQAELSQKGQLFVRFDGGISPKALSRQVPEPIAARIEGTIRVPSGQDPPSLSQIRIALNRGARLDSRGLPTCRAGQIATGTSSEALATCGSALIGSGGIVAQTDFPDQSPYLLRGNVTLFNGVEHGRSVILAQIYQGSPAPITNIVTFEIHHSPGTFGTVITAALPPSLEHGGYLKSIFLNLQRTYVFHGQRRSYLSASCSAPAGFTVATFPFAQASMTFDDGRSLSSTLYRSCRVSKS
jgi:hypothetical protein